MTDINLKTLTPDTSLPTTGFLFGADSQASTNPSVYSTQTVATTLLGSTSLTGDTLTADAPVLNLAQTWNNAAVTFTGIKLNVTNTASTGYPFLMDLQVGGVSRISSYSAGYLTVLNRIHVGSVGLNCWATDAGAMQFTTGNGRSVVLGASTSGLSLASTYQLAFTSKLSSGDSLDGQDTFITRKAAANLRFGAADAASPVAQTLSVQSIVAGQTNASAAAYPFTITGSQGTGSGAGGSIVFQVAPAGGSGTAQNALSTALTIASDRSATFTSSTTTLNVNTTQTITPAIANLLAPSLAVGNTAYLNLGRDANTKNWAGFGFYYAGNGSSSNAFTLAFYGTGNIWGITADTTNTLMFLGGQTSSFPALKRSSTTLQARLADDSAFASVQGKLTTDNAYTAGAVVQTGYVTIYDSTGTAYKVLVGT